MRISDKDGVLIAGTKIDSMLINSAPCLKAICCASVVYNNIDTEKTQKRGIISPDVLNETVADLILALMLSSSRRIAELEGWVRQGFWKPSDNEIFFGSDVHHKTLGIIGMGKTEAEQNLGVVYQEFDVLLSESDFIVIIAPLTDKILWMIGKREFSLTKNTAFFINASRGQIVNEEALIEALRTKTIAGAVSGLSASAGLNCNSLKLPRKSFPAYFRSGYTTLSRMRNIRKSLIPLSSVRQRSVHIRPCSFEHQLVRPGCSQNKTMRSLRHRL